MGLKGVGRVYLVLYLGLFWCPVCEDTRLPLGLRQLPDTQASRISLISASSSLVDHGDCRQNYSVRLDVGSGNASGSRACVASPP